MAHSVSSASNAAPAVRTAAGDEPSVGTLVQSAMADLSTLMRAEVELAKAEVTDSAKKAGKGAGLLGGAGVAGYFALLFLSICVWWALGSTALGNAWSALIIAVVYGIAAAILLLYWPLVLLPGLDGLPADIAQRGHNFTASVDRVLLGAGNHIYVPGPAGYDPEGLLGTLPAIAHGLIGAAIGELLVRAPGRASARTLALAGLAMLAAGLAWSLFFPVIKDIWSSSFVLVTAGATTLVLALLHATIDGPSAKPSRLLLVPLAFGGNAIAAYALHMVTGSLLGWDVLLAPYTLARTVVPDAWASLIPIVLYMALIWLFIDYLRRKRWVVKV